MTSNSEWTQILTAAVEKSIAETFSTTATTATTDSNITADELIAKMNDAMKKIGPPPVDPSRLLIDRVRETHRIREAVLKQNELIQRKWDREFNHRVLDVVRKALHRGMIQVMIHEELRLDDFNDADAQSMSIRPVKTITVRYDKYRKDAYWHLREQAENAVRASMPPPRLHKVP